MAKINEDRGKYVTRSIYQKVCEENKKLKEDLWIITMGETNEKWMDVFLRWQDKFEKDSQLKQALHEFAVQYFIDNPEKRIIPEIDKVLLKK